MKTIGIRGDHIKLDSFLKFSGIAETGGEAKRLVASGIVLLNGAPCLERGKKIKPGDIVKIQDFEYLITTEEDI